MSVPVLRSHQNEHEGKVSGTLDGEGWSAKYNGDSDLRAGPQTGTFTDEAGTSWTAAQLGAHAERAVRYVDWHTRIQKLPPDRPGRSITSTSVPLKDETTYFRRTSARQGSGANGQKRDRWYCTHLGWLQEYNEADLQLQEIGDEPVGGAAQWGSATVTWNDDIQDTRDGTAAPDSAAVGAKQRLRIHVPNVFTKLTLGEAYRNQDSQGFAYPGFGVETEGHVFVHARGGKANSKMSLQSNGQLLIQSDQDSLYMVSSGPNVLATPAAVNLAGGGGVNIAAGLGTSVSNPDSDGAAAGPEGPAAVQGLPDHLSTISTWWSRIDSGMAALAIAAGVIQARFANPSSSWVSRLLTAGNLSAAGCITNNTLGEFGENPANGGVTIHGSAGWLLGTPLYGSAYAAAGLTIGSAFPAMMALVDAGIVAGRAIGLAAKKEISLTAGKEVSILAGNKLEISSRGSGGTAVKGQKIVVGSAAGAGTQGATDSLAVVAKKVVVSAKDRLALTAKKKASLRAKEVAVGADKLTLSGSNKASLQAKKVGVWGDNGVAIGSKGFFVNVGKSNLKLGNIKKPWPDAPAYEPPSQDEINEALASDTPLANLRALKLEAEDSHTQKLMAWLDKVADLDHKNCSIELKNGDIKLEVHGSKFKIDSSKTAIGNTLKVMF